MKWSVDAMIHRIRLWLARAIVPAPFEVWQVERTKTGLWSQLTPEQRQAALDYDGPEVHGDDKP